MVTEEHRDDVVEYTMTCSFLDSPNHDRSSVCWLYEVVDRLDSPIHDRSSVCWLYELVDQENLEFWGIECVLTGRDRDYEIDRVLSEKRADHKHGQHSPCSA